MSERPSDQDRLANNLREKDYAEEEERRRSRRFLCAGEVKISRLPSDGVFLPGKILDLSLHGCRVDAGQAIVDGSRAEIVLHINAASFRAMGEVRAIRDGSGTGIEFVQLSAGGKNMLADLIQELASLQAAMNKLRVLRREPNGRSFRAQLEQGKDQAESVRRRLDLLRTILTEVAPEASAEFSREKEAVFTAGVETSNVDNSKVEIPNLEPLVLQVDLFG